MQGLVLMTLMGKALMGTRPSWARSQWAQGLNGQGHWGKVMGGISVPQAG